LTFVLLSLEFLDPILYVGEGPVESESGAELLPVPSELFEVFKQDVVFFLGPSGGLHEGGPALGWFFADSLHYLPVGFLAEECLLR